MEKTRNNNKSKTKWKLQNKMGVKVIPKILVVIIKL